MDLKIKCKIIKLTGKKTRKSLGHRVRQRVLRHDTKNTIPERKKINQWDFFQLKTCTLQKTLLT